MGSKHHLNGRGTAKLGLTYLMDRFGLQLATENTKHYGRGAYHVPLGEIFNGTKPS